jgi:hypothetical protein
MAGRSTASGGDAEGTATVLAAAGSHLYRGAQGILREGRGAEGPCLVEFADGSLAFGRLVMTDERVVLELDAYTTARGTMIPAKRWSVAVMRRGGEAHFRIGARLG